MGRSATVECVHIFYGLHRQAVGGSLRLCGDITSDEICTVDIFGMSFSLEEYFVKSVCFVPCKLILLLIPFWGPLDVRWYIKRFSVFAHLFGLRSEMELCLWIFPLTELWPCQDPVVSSRAWLPALKLSLYNSTSSTLFKFQNMFLSLNDVQERKDLVLYDSSNKHWRFICVMSILQEIDLPLENSD